MPFNQTKLIQELTNTTLTDYQVLQHITQQIYFTTFLFFVLVPSLLFLLVGIFNRDLRMNLSYWVLFTIVVSGLVFLFIFTVILPAIPSYTGGWINP